MRINVPADLVEKLLAFPSEQNLAKLREIYESQMRSHKLNQTTDLYLAAVADFHNAFSQTVAPALSWPGADVCRLRASLIQEELNEYSHAVQEADLIGVVDALADLMYVLAGTILVHGVQGKFDKVFLEVHRSNMAKIGPTGIPVYREDGKVLKPATWSAPDIVAALSD